ncbi:histidinol dehydrogenase [Methanobrevibacter filiformis]|uniref:Histidinol dehydrogenase n=1 Tax=Methanobrevibacter filiformis TaxID=55758 RepID=A0A166FCX9_9EURY|nr:histidinol dehydrogenase [Methanobrevibacter filiformis]KZX17549.1 histidinol dehydrogenase [Methanobrevibacter filiformis]
MRISEYEANTIENLLKRSQNDINNVLPTVSDILKDIKENKNIAIKKYSKKFDNTDIEELKVSKEEIAESYNEIDNSLINAMKKAIKNIEKFHKFQIPEKWFKEIDNGIWAGQIIRPIENVGCYIPGGRAVYPSTILMTVIPAKIAKVPRIVACSPPDENGKIAPGILVAADLAGVNEIYKVGGAQAIGAMAYGTETIEPVDKIVGPGNIFVTGAKKLVYGDVDIEFPAGPSEILIIADSSANPKFIAQDILSQAEHDPNASCFLVTDDKSLAEEVNKYVNEFSEMAIRNEIIKESLRKYGQIIITKSIEESIEVSNKYAPEHLIIMTNKDEKVLEKINNAGSIFLGQLSPVASGDYGSGTNHVLPTAGGARMYSGLSTESFLKKPTVQKINAEGLDNLKDIVIPIAEYEGFYAHSDSLKIRLNDKKNENE